jgi:hypothetical protein
MLVKIVPPFGDLVGAVGNVIENGHLSTPDWATGVK